jgi:hypothetical protein
MNQLLIEMMSGVCGLILFRYGNENKRLINIISICLLLVIVSREAMSITAYGYIVYKLSVMGLGVAYWSRFKEKQGKTIIDYLKCVVLIMIVLYPLNSLFLSNRSEHENIFFIAFTTLTFLATVIILIIDKWTLVTTGKR